MTKNLSKLETKEKPTEKLASSGELNFSAKPKTKVYDGIPKGNDADALF